MLALADNSEYGAQLNVYDLATSFRTHYDIHVVLGFTGRLSQRLTALGVEVSEVPELGDGELSRSALSASAQFRRIVRSFQPALIHCHMTMSSVAMRAVAWAEDVPVLYSAHRWPFSRGVSNRGRASGWVAEVLGSRFTSHTVCTDEFSVELAKRYLRLADDTVCAVPCGLGHIDEISRAPSNRVELVMIADFRAPHDHETIIRALTYIEPGTCRLRLVGRGPGLYEAIALASELGVCEDIVFLGEGGDRSTLFATSDIYVQTTVGPGGATPVLEAMRAGLPVVVSQQDGADEVVEESTTGFLVASKDAESTALALQRLIDDVELREKMGSVGLEVFEESFTRALMIERFADVYAQTRNCE